MNYDIEYILKISNRYHREAKRCYENNCYLASFVMYGAVLEGYLLAMCFCQADKVRRTEKYLDIKRRYKKKYKEDRKRGFFLEFSLRDLLKIAEELKWIPFDEKVGDAGIVRDWIFRVKQTRNLIHPARWLKEDDYFNDLHKWIKIKRGEWQKLKKFVEISEETVSEIVTILEQENNQDLIKQLRGDDQLSS